MASMDVSVEVCFGKEAAGEIVLSVDFKYRSGSFDTWEQPADPPELEIETIFWPIQRWDKEKRAHVADHIEMPYSGLPGPVADAIEAYILENYQSYDDAYEEWDQ